MPPVGFESTISAGERPHIYIYVYVYDISNLRVNPAVPCSKCIASTLLTRKPEISHQITYPHLGTVINDSGIATQ
jgi:hypothetical protein